MGHIVVVFAICVGLLQIAVTMTPSVMVTSGFHSDIAINVLNGHGFVSELGGGLIF